MIYRFVDKSSNWGLSTDLDVRLTFTEGKGSFSTATQQIDRYPRCSQHGYAYDLVMMCPVIFWDLIY